jgi:hypothetical protein
MSGPVRPERLTAAREAPFVVFLIGMRFNKPWKLWQWWPVFSAMPRMLQELGEHPELGFLGGHSWIGRTTITLQYWESFDALDAYAKAPDHTHLPAWRAFSRAVGNSGDVGIWHETYEVNPGKFEAIYANMPPFGMGRVGPLVPATGGLGAARQRKMRAAIADRSSLPPEM